MTRGSGDGGASLCSAFAGAPASARSRSRGACQPNANPRTRLRRIEQQFNGYRVHRRPARSIYYIPTPDSSGRMHARASDRAARAGRPRAARRPARIPAAPGGDVTPVLGPRRWRLAPRPAAPARRAARPRSRARRGPAEPARRRREGPARAGRRGRSGSPAAPRSDSPR